MASDLAQQQSNAALGLRVAVAATACVLVAEWLRLPMSYVSVISVHIVMAQYTFTAFQKGVERVLGRFLGLGYALVLVLFFRQVPFVYLLLMVAGLLVFMYVYAAGRFSYTALQASFMIGALAEIGIAEPQQVQSTAINIFGHILLGVTLAVLVNWLTGAERTAAIVPGGEPLWPLRREWLSRALMLTTIVVTTIFLTMALGLSVIPATVSALMLGMSPDLKALWKKSKQRALGALLGGLYGLAALILLTAVPSFLLLLLLLFLVMFLAAYFTKASTENSYVFLQMGLASPMVLIDADNTPGSLAPAVQRFVGVGLGLFVSMVVEWLWLVSAPLPPTPAAPEAAPDADEDAFS